MRVMTISITITILLSQLLSVNILSLSQLLNNNGAHYLIFEYSNNSATRQIIQITKRIS